MKRVIFVEPIIENDEEIKKLFNKYNPDSSFVNPHICLVFPFESDLSTETIDSIFQKELQEVNEFNLQLSGLSISYEGKNNFLFLDVTDEENNLKRISERLYRKLGSNATLRGEYTPHITIGKSKSPEEIERVHDEAGEKRFLSRVSQPSVGNCSLQ